MLNGFDSHQRHFNYFIECSSLSSFFSFFVFYGVFSYLFSLQIISMLNGRSMSRHQAVSVSAVNVFLSEYASQTATDFTFSCELRKKKRLSCKTRTA